MMEAKCRKVDAGMTLSQINKAIGGIGMKKLSLAMVVLMMLPFLNA